MDKLKASALLVVITIIASGTFFSKQKPAYGCLTDPCPAEWDGRLISNLSSGKCIDVAGAPGSANGARLLLWDCERSGRNRDNGSPTDHIWVIENGLIVNKLSGKCIDVAGAPGSTNGAPLQLWDCERSGRNRDNGSTTDQRWVVTSQGFIRNRLSGKCIDVAGAPGSTNGAQLQLWDCELSGRNRDNASITDQRWRLDGI
ncbi:ricin-type beta-trefoil lectin domain protein [Hassallia byssoidea VB512170]|uniref:Ricin-type beta-trefoil lectin domain protein n=1 Tax=Hassallia byssoidea VB512170 TaxID=1304833 RepID=A0A846H6F6_9CYAN|nr:RICIN domain-containing protein [Hassalia byssoidea]NEU72558.1 ricin-type beta-trefoil lectin domain protein [Hassalia byssoidea VB512170]